MANREYSKYQQKVIRRYYENRDQIDDQRLSELVAGLFLADGKMWKTAAEIMLRLNVPENRVKHVVGTDDPAILAEVVRDLQSGRIS